METAEPVVLVIFDAKRDRAYWTYVQAQFADWKTAYDPRRRTTVVRVPVMNVMTEAAVRTFEQFSDDVWHQQRGIIRHHE